MTKVKCKRCGHIYKGVHPYDRSCNPVSRYARGYTCPKCSSFKAEAISKEK